MMKAFTSDVLTTLENSSTQLIVAGNGEG